MQTTHYPTPEIDRQLVDTIRVRRYAALAAGYDSLVSTAGLFLENLNSDTQAAVGNTMLNSGNASWQDRLDKDYRKPKSSSDIMRQNSSQDTPRPVIAPVSLAGESDYEPLVEGALLREPEPSNMIDAMYSETLAERKNPITVPVPSNEGITPESARRAIEEAYGEQSYKITSDQFTTTA